MKCTFLWITPVKEPCPLKVLKRRSSAWWASNPPTLSRRRRQSWRDSSRRMLTFGGRLMKWTNGTSDRPVPTKASSWWWANACPLCPIKGFFFFFLVVSSEYANCALLVWSFFDVMHHDQRGVYVGRYHWIPVLWVCCHSRGEMLNFLEKE